jgi:hypothetical protein
VLKAELRFLKENLWINMSVLRVWELMYFVIQREVSKEGMPLKTMDKKIIAAKL